MFVESFEGSLYGPYFFLGGKGSSGLECDCKLKISVTSPGRPEGAVRGRLSLSRPSLRRRGMRGEGACALEGETFPRLGCDFWNCSRILFPLPRTGYVPGNLCEPRVKQNTTGLGSVHTKDWR